MKGKRTRTELMAENEALRGDLKTAVGKIEAAVMVLCRRNDVTRDTVPECGDTLLGELAVYLEQRGAKTKKLFEQVYQLAGNDQKKAAEMLGVSQPSVHRYLQGGTPNLAVVCFARSIVAKAGQTPRG